MAYGRREIFRLPKFRRFVDLHRLRNHHERRRRQRERCWKRRRKCERRRALRWLRAWTHLLQSAQRRNLQVYQPEHGPAGLRRLRKYLWRECVLRKWAMWHASLQHDNVQLGIVLRHGLLPARPHLLQHGRGTRVRGRHHVPVRRDSMLSLRFLRTRLERLVDRQYHRFRIDGLFHLIGFVIDAIAHVGRVTS